MQRYQVFIDEHSILLIDKPKRNQQFNSVFEIFSPDSEEIGLIIKWLSIEEEEVLNVCLLSKSIDDLWRNFQSNFKIIEAAGGLVTNSKDEILFINRLSKWDLPKGKVEEGEKIEEAAIREVEEECGISNLKIVGNLVPTYHIYKHKEQYVLKKTHWFNMTYEGEEELIPQKEEGIEEVCWLAKTNLEDQISNTYASLKHMILAVKA